MTRRRLGPTALAAAAVALALASCATTTPGPGPGDAAFARGDMQTATGELLERSGGEPHRLRPDQRLRLALALATPGLTTSDAARARALLASWPADDPLAAEARALADLLGFTAAAEGARRELATEVRELGHELARCRRARDGLRLRATTASTAAEDERARTAGLVMHIDELERALAACEADALRLRATLEELKHVDLQDE